jgi:Zinc carboxypeptidase
MRRGLRCALTLALGVVAGNATAQDAAAPIVMGQRYRQSAEVLARYPDLGMTLGTPALQLGRTTLTSQEEMETFILKLVKPAAPVVVETLVTTPHGRTLPILYLTRERLIVPAAIRATARPIVWLIGQQHGNEPAGGEAMLAIAKALVEGELRPLLDKIVVVIVPRANPDGAATDQRDTSARMDLNRDHATLALTETRALHTAVQRLPPDLVIDAHEFSVAQRWIEKFGGLQAVDLMLLDATHPMVPEASRRIARAHFIPAIESAIAKHGLSTFLYHTTSTRMVDRTIAMGGNAPGIARNAFGLTGAVSLLLETRGVGIGMESYQRRVATHYIAIRAALEAAAADPDQLRDAVAASRREIAERRNPIVVRHSVENDTVTLPLVDAVTGAARTAETLMSNSKRVTITAHRSWPAGYILLPEAKGGTAEIRLLGAGTCLVTRLVEIDAEMFEVHDRGTSDRRAINPDAAVKAVVRAVRVAIPAGSIYVPTAQAAGNRIALALEPDAPGSFVAVDLVRTPPDQTTVPIVRIPAGTKLPLAPATAADAALCAQP